MFYVVEYKEKIRNPSSVDPIYAVIVSKLLLNLSDTGGGTRKAPL
jgi:hypothetical protein